MKDLGKRQIDTEGYEDEFAPPDIDTYEHHPTKFEFKQQST